jgi:hypothetical protein
VLQICLDESGKGDPDLFVIAGYVSTTERWAAFADEWQKLLDHDSRHYRKLEYFKMAEMTSKGDRERCRWFYNVIEEHALAAVSFALSTKELTRQVRRMFNNPKDAGVLANPWHFVSHLMIPEFVRGMESLGLPPGPVDFVFDDVSEKENVLSSWKDFKAAFPEEAKMIPGPPIFRSDMDYLPLQAADLLAWWVRHWQVDGLKGGDIYNCEFAWPRSRTLIWRHMGIDRLNIRKRLAMARRAIYPTITVSVQVSSPSRSS